MSDLSHLFTDAANKARGSGLHAHEGPGYTIGRVEPVNTRCRPLSAELYPDCPLCGHSIATCPCDPDETAEALWLQFKAQKESQL